LLWWSRLSTTTEHAKGRMATTLMSEAFPPGEYLREELEERGWSAKEFAEILGRPAQAVSEILKGKKQIVPATALAIGEALGTSASLWMKPANRLQSVRSAIAAPRVD